METKDSLESLKNSLIYTMSLGSRELYHSNVWAWLMENDPAFIKTFFHDYDETGFKIDTSKGCKVRREWEHLDISIVMHNDEKKICYLLENKIKSLMDTEQLLKYLKKLKELGFNEVYVVYTGIVNMLTETDINHIKNNDSGITVNDCYFLSYREINDNINELLKTCSGVVKDNKATLEKYTETIDNLYNLLTDINIYPDGQNKDDCPFSYEINGHIDLDYRDVRLYDYFKKLKGCDFLKYVKGKLEDKTEKYGLTNFTYGEDKYVMYFNQDFNRKKVTLDLRWAHDDDLHNKNGWDGKRVIGIQIEDYDYRFVYGVPSNDSKDDGEYDTAFDEICNVNCDDKWLDNKYSEHVNKLFDREDYNTSLKITKGKSYNKYGGVNRKQTFIYQYYNLPGKDKGTSPLTYKELYERIKGDLKRAEEIIKKMPILNK